MQELYDALFVLCRVRFKYLVDWPKILYDDFAFVVIDESAVEIVIADFPYRHSFLSHGQEAAFHRRYLTSRHGYNNVDRFQQLHLRTYGHACRMVNVEHALGILTGRVNGRMKDEAGEIHPEVCRAAIY